MSAVLRNGGLALSAAIPLDIAETMVDIARVAPDGFGHLRFALGVNSRLHTPFFPVEFHAGEPAVALALEATATDCWSVGSLGYWRPDSRQ